MAVLKNSRQTATKSADLWPICCKCGANETTSDSGEVNSGPEAPAACRSEDGFREAVHQPSSDLHTAGAFPRHAICGDGMPLLLANAIQR